MAAIRVLESSTGHLTAGTARAMLLGCKNLVQADGTGHTQLCQILSDVGGLLVVVGGGGWMHLQAGEGTY